MCSSNCKREQVSMFCMMKSYSSSIRNIISCCGLSSIIRCKNPCLPCYETDRGKQNTKLKNVGACGVEPPAKTWLQYCYRCAVPFCARKACPRGFAYNEGFLTYKKQKAPPCNSTQYKEHSKWWSCGI